MLPRADVMKLRDRLINEELAAGSIFCRLRNRTLRHEATSDVGHRREMCAHARILALEEAIDTEWVYMWDKFGGYLLLLLGLTAKAERVQVTICCKLLVCILASLSSSSRFPFPFYAEHSMLCQDEVRLRLFLDNIGFSDLSAKDIKKWLPEDRRRFEIIQER